MALVCLYLLLCVSVYPNPKTQIAPARCHRHFRLLLPFPWRHFFRSTGLYKPAYTKKRIPPPLHFLFLVDTSFDYCTLFFFFLWYSLLHLHAFGCAKRPRQLLPRAPKSKSRPEKSPVLQVVVGSFTFSFAWPCLLESSLV